MSTLLNVLASCRSTRRFTDQPVPQELIDQIVDVARWTGSARNRQPWRFVSVTDPSLKAELSRLGDYAHHLAAAPAVLALLSADDGRRDTEFDVGRISQSICLAAHALNLGSCLATLYPEENIAAAARLLGADAGWLPRHAVSIGYPADRAAPGQRAVPSGRLTVSQLITHL